MLPEVALPQGSDPSAQGGARRRAGRLRGLHGDPVVDHELQVGGAVGRPPCGPRRAAGRRSGRCTTVVLGSAPARRRPRRRMPPAPPAPPRRCRPRRRPCRRRPAALPCRRCPPALPPVPLPPLLPPAAPPPLPLPPVPAPPAPPLAPLPPRPPALPPLPSRPSRCRRSAAAVLAAGTGDAQRQPASRPAPGWSSEIAVMPSPLAQALVGHVPDLALGPGEHRGRRRARPARS